jgi:hypothetical protein
MPENFVSGPRLGPGSPVVIVLHTPREKCWGVLEEISPAGIFVRGVDLGAFEDWIRAVSRDEPFHGPNSQFFPMWRVERVTLDQSEPGLPSMVEQAQSRTGLSVQAMLGLDGEIEENQPN